MIHAYCDVSMDEPILAVGYVLYKSKCGDEKLLETGTRVLNTDHDSRDINWTPGRGEYWSTIVSVRAALEYTSEPIIVYNDNLGVVKAIRNESWHHEDYFPHCLKSFLHRFNDYHVQYVHRDNNEVAHRQANVGLQIGREIEAGKL